MMSLEYNVISALAGRTIATAESLTGGGIGAALTAVPGCSEVYKGGVISYTDEIKEKLLGVPGSVLKEFGAVSGPTAKAMAQGARERLCTDIAVSVTGLAGPGGDSFGNPVGTVYIGYSDPHRTLFRRYAFSGDRAQVRSQTIKAALNLILEYNRDN